VSATRVYGREPVPRKTSLNWFIPAFVNRSVGSSWGTIGALGTISWPFSRKKSRKAWRVCSEVCGRNTVFFDTNVVLDAMLIRQPFEEESSRVLSMAERGRISGLVSSLSVVTAWYIVRRQQDRTRAATAVEYIHDVLHVTPVSHSEISVALADLRSGAFADFEDAVQHASALSVGAEAFVTRNTRDFAGARLPVLTPAELLAAR
jgi:predicted nucleic acid-binding protein